MKEKQGSEIPYSLSLTNYDVHFKEVKQLHFSLVQCRRTKVLEILSTLGPKLVFLIPNTFFKYRACAFETVLIMSCIEYWKSYKCFLISPQNFETYSSKLFNMFIKVIPKPGLTRDIEPGRPSI